MDGEKPSVMKKYNIENSNSLIPVINIKLVPEPTYHDFIIYMKVKNMVNCWEWLISTAIAPTYKCQ